MASSVIPIDKPTAVQITNISKVVWSRCGKVVTIAIYGASPISATELTTNPPPKPITGMECELFYGNTWVGFLEFNPSLQVWRVAVNSGYGYGTLTYVCE